MQGFEEMIQRLEPKLKVLDVGAWGLKGENTSRYIKDKFKDVTYMNNKHYEGVTLVADFYTYKFKEKFDLIVMDTNVSLNVTKDWTPKGLKRLRGLLNKGGTLLIYMITTDEYGEKEGTPKLIRKGWKEFWNSKGRTITNEEIGKKLENIPGFKLFIYLQEKWRPIITWVALTKK